MFSVRQELGGLSVMLKRFVFQTLNVYCRRLSTFRKNVLPPFLGSKRNPCMQPTMKYAQNTARRTFLRNVSKLL
jgi:hypothetical protein